MSSAQEGTSSLSPEAYEKALQMCKKWDIDGDGAISHGELSKALVEIFPGCTSEDVAGLVKSVDVNGDGVIQYQEFLQWLALPNVDRLSFEEQFSQFVIETVDAAPPTALMRSSSPGLRKTDPHVFDDFCHPVLDKLQVVTSTQVLPKTVVVQEGPRGGRGCPVQAQMRRRSDGVSLAIMVPPPVSSTYFGRDREGSPEDHLLARVEAMAQTYRAIFEEFCASEPPKGPPVDAGLRLSLLPLSDNRGASHNYSAALFLSAIALAALRLNKAEQDRLKQITLFELYMQDSTASDYRAALDEKVRAARSAPRPPQEGKLPTKERNLDWIRKDNSAESRLQRLQSFFITQRAVWNRGYELDSAGGKLVALNTVDQMLKGTKMIGPTKSAGSRAPASSSVQVVTVSELKNVMMNDGSTVMDVAQELTSKGVRVAAVSAASAYQVGG